MEAQGAASYSNRVRRERETRRKGINILVWFFAGLIALSFLFDGKPPAWLARLDRAPAIEFGLRLVGAALVVFLASKVRRWLFRMMALDAAVRFRHLEGNEEELIAQLREAYKWYLEIMPRMESLNWARLATTVPAWKNKQPSFDNRIKAAIREDARSRANEVLANEGASDAEYRKRIPFFGDAASCRVAAQYYFKYLKEPHNIAFGWKYDKPEVLGEFLWEFHQKDLVAIGEAKAFIREQEESRAEQAVPEDRIGVVKEALGEVRQVNDAFFDMETQMESEREREIAQAGDDLGKKRRIEERYTWSLRILRQAKERVLKDVFQEDV